MRHLFFLVLVVVASCALGQILVGLQGKFVVLQESEGYVDVQGLQQLGLTFVLSEVSGRAYLIFEKKIVLLNRDGTVSVDFLDVYEESAKFVGKRVFIKAELLQNILGLKAYKTVSGQIVLLDSVPILVSAVFEKNQLKLRFAGFISEQMVSARTSKGKLTVEISPCLSSAMSLEPVKIPG